ncbi:MAG: EthD domain-containing protein [Gammaproteobacteria bacterium]
MIKLVSVIQRREGLDVAAFQDHWLNVHGPLVSRLPGLRRYVQSHTLASAYAKLVPAADGIAELWFDDTAALRALHGTPALTAVERDESEFIDPTRHLRLFIDEHLVKDGPIPAGGVKNIELVRRRPGMPVADFQRYWREVHGPLGAAIPTVERYVQNHARASSYREGSEPPLDGLALTWFADTAAMRASAASPEYALTRADEDNFLDAPLDFIITHEHVIVA